MKIQPKFVVFILLSLALIVFSIIDYQNKNYVLVLIIIIFTFIISIKALLQTNQTIVDFERSERAQEKLYEPIIHREITVNDSVDNVYRKSLDWLKDIGAYILEEYPPIYIKAKHGQDPIFNSGDESKLPIKNWLKIIEIKLSTKENMVKVNISMDQWWKKTILDIYDQRKREWPELVDDYMLFINANMSKIQKGYLIQDMRVQILKQATFGLIVFLVVEYFAFQNMLSRFGNSLGVRVLLYVGSGVLLFQYLRSLWIRYQILQNQC